jgi:glycerol-3-phosphate dehydrogenase (NAD(P)+)
MERKTRSVFLPYECRKQYGTKSAVALARKFNIEMPIAEKMYSVLYEGRRPHDAIHDLMERKLKEE